MSVELEGRPELKQICAALLRQQDAGAGVDVELWELLREALDAPTSRGAVQQAVDSLADALMDQRMTGHAEGQEHTLADVNAGLVDDWIQPRLGRR